MIEGDAGEFIPNEESAAGMHRFEVSPGEAGERFLNLVWRFTTVCRDWHAMASAGRHCGLDGVLGRIVRGLARPAQARAKLLPPALWYRRSILSRAHPIPARQNKSIWSVLRRWLKAKTYQQL